jgi:hypothetical protein
METLFKRNKSDTGSAIRGGGIGYRVWAASGITMDYFILLQLNFITCT